VLRSEVVIVFSFMVAVTLIVECNCVSRGLTKIPRQCKIKNYLLLLYLRGLSDCKDYVRLVNFVRPTYLARGRF